MNERIEELAIQAGLESVSDDLFYAYNENLERFAELVAAAEREKCAELCANVVSNQGYVQAKYCAAAIRARGEQA